MSKQHTPGPMLAALKSTLSDGALSDEAAFAIVAKAIAKALGQHSDDRVQARDIGGGS